MSGKSPRTLPKGERRIFVFWKNPRALPRENGRFYCRGRNRGHSPGRTADFLYQGRIREHSPGRTADFCVWEESAGTPQGERQIILSGKKPRALPKGERRIFYIKEESADAPQGGRSGYFRMPGVSLPAPRSLARQAPRKTGLEAPHPQRTGRLRWGWNGQPAKTAACLGDCPCPCAARGAFADGRHRASPSATSPGKVLSGRNPPGTADFNWMMAGDADETYARYSPFSLM